MARKRKSKSTSRTVPVRRKTRVVPNPVNANRRQKRLSFTLAPRRSTVLKDDRRLYNPTPARQRLVSGSSVVTTPRPRNVPGRGSFLRERVAFKNPRQVMTCVRRKRRREVLFATGGTSKVRRNPKWTEKSYIAC